MSCNTATNVKHRWLKDYNYPEKYWKYNYMPELRVLYDKRQMHMTLNAFIDEHGIDEFPYLPTTFLLPEQLKEFKRAFKNESNKLWITKVVSSVQIFQ